jgi:hypothetical protein
MTMTIACRLLGDSDGPAVGPLGLGATGARLESLEPAGSPTPTCGTVDGSTKALRGFEDGLGGGLPDRQIGPSEPIISRRTHRMAPAIQRTWGRVTCRGGRSEIDCPPDDADTVTGGARCSNL